MDFNMKKLPLILFILLAACAPVPQVTVTPSAISTEQPFVGYGGELTEDQQAFIESEDGIRLAQAYDDYANYLMQASKDGGGTYWAKGTKISLIPMMDSKYPGDISKGFFVGEITTDLKKKGSFFTMPMSQVKKYLETRDVNVLAPPPSTGKLFDYSEPVFLTRQVTEGSAPAEAGIEIGSILQFFDQNFVYQAGTLENLEITGHMDENFKWVADSEKPNDATDLLTGGPTWYETDDLAQYKEIKQEKRNLNGMETNVMVADGKVIAAEVDGDWTRMIEYIDSEGNVFYAYQNMQIGMGPSGAFQLKDGATEVLVERLFKELSQGQFKGQTPEQIKAKMLENAKNGKLTKIMTATSPDNITEANKWDAEWEEIEIDPSKPWEIITIGSEEEFNSLPENWQQELTDWTSEPGLKADGFIKTGADGHIILVGVDTAKVKDFGGLTTTGLEAILSKYDVSRVVIIRNGGKFTGRLLLFGLQRLSNYQKSSAMTTYPGNSEGGDIMEAFTDSWWDAQAGQ